MKKETSIDFAGVKVNCLTRDSLTKSTQTGNTNILVTANAQIFSLLNKNPILKQNIDKFLICIDGQIPFFCARILNKSINIEKISGSDLIYDLLDKNTFGIFNRVALIGGSNDTAAELHSKLVKKGKKFISFTPFVTNNGECKNFDLIKSDLNIFNPDLVLLALGAPKQEIFSLKIADSLDFPKLIFCCGGSVDFYIGKFRRAPRFLSKFGLESIYRLIQEPTAKRILRIFYSFGFFIYIIRYIR